MDEANGSGSETTLCYDVGRDRSPHFRRTSWREEDEPTSRPKMAVSKEDETTPPKLIHPPVNDE